VNPLNKDRSERHESAKIECVKPKKKTLKENKSGSVGLPTNKFLHREILVKQVRNPHLHQFEETEAIAKPSARPKKRRSKPRPSSKEENRR
jgi:hypothetical protein